MPTILIVDDEPTILTLAAMALGRQYRVLTAPSAAMGLEVLAGTAIDLLLTDHRMPEMTGAEMLRTAREDHPGLPCILSTGYTEASELKVALDSGNVRLLFKPWSPTELRQAVAEALETGG